MSYGNSDHGPMVTGYDIGRGPTALTDCPFSLADLQAVAATCPVGLNVSCDVTPPVLSVGIFCNPGGPVQNLGSWVLDQDANTLTHTTVDPETGNPVAVVYPLTAAQEIDCMTIFGICPPQ